VLPLLGLDGRALEPAELGGLGRLPAFEPLLVGGVGVPRGRGDPLDGGGVIWEPLLGGLDGGVATGRSVVRRGLDIRS
jgi:hypothetical protein